MFVNGDLKGKFIMDRNLGARDPNRANDGRGNLFFQCGRKDPLPGGVSGFETVAYTGRGENAEDTIMTLAVEDGPVSIASTVQKPTSFYKGSNWSSDVSSESYVWLDYEQDVSNNGKSIFDPSPLGWKVPIYGTWGNFTTEDFTDYVEGGSMGYPRDNPFAYYHMTGLRSVNSGALSNFNTQTTYWTSTALTIQYSRGFWILSGVVPPDTNTYGSRGMARTQRPVQHYE